ncbi:hypothetical protein HHI36_019749 [Cryptolaemus montrouzieri]|uniref:Uncharacterized protein n=1 Tax=Cryptolaemus montrouzieri TaxID=559131 RepID=A0ABD2N8Q5_9CUCU
MCKIIVLIFFMIPKLLVLCDFTFPEIKLEAFEPKGLRVSIPEIENVRLFAFHGRRNRPLSQIEPGEFSKDIVNPKSNGWSYINPDLKLNVGDKVYYWAFIQHGMVRYVKDSQVWEVKELLPRSQLNVGSCTSSITEHIFDNFIDENKWKRAHFIAAEPDFEFCSYQKRNDTSYIKDGKLIIQPIAITKDEEVLGVLDLRNGCTSHRESDCYTYEDSGFILPPVISAKMKTNRNFKYGKVEVKAKLPGGDWIYPEIYLESASLPIRRVWIAYARGNERLIGNGGEDLGGSLLFGGPIFNFSEPERSKYLSSKKSNETFSNSFHIYSIVWEPTKLSLFVDDVLYGEIKNDIASLLNEPMHLVLGVGVGGIMDFPDFYVSSNNKRKPWINFERLSMKKFFRARQDWMPTWNEGKSSLIVEYAKIWAL